MDETSGYDPEGLEEDPEGYGTDGPATGYDGDGYGTEGYGTDGYSATGYDADGYDAEADGPVGDDMAGYGSGGYGDDGYGTGAPEVEGLGTAGDSLSLPGTTSDAAPLDGNQTGPGGDEVPLLDAAEPASDQATYLDVDTRSFGAAVDGPADPALGEDGDEPSAALFPPALPGVDLPAPVDGPPWVDVSSLAAEPSGPTGQQGSLGLGGPGADSPTLLGDLRESAAEPGAGWDGLRGSDDPAVRALAGFWAPGAAGRAR